MDFILDYLPMIGRSLIGFFFVFFGISNTVHWRQIVNVMQQKKIPFALQALFFGIVLQTIAGLLLIWGRYVTIAALVLIPFDIVAVLMFHNFWNCEGEIRRLNQIIFVTNLTVALGSLLLLVNTVEPNAMIGALFN